MQPSSYDVIIIGTGSGGGTLAQKLAPSGEKILLLERGDFIPKEKENWDVDEVVVKGRYRADEVWYDKDDQPFKPFTHYVVGGNSKMYGAASFRLRESDFREVQHPAGVSPAWPLTYADFAPYYTQAERLFSVHGVRGIDPFEPPASDPYPFGSIPIEPFTEELYQHVQQTGLKPFPIPMAVRLAEDNPYWPDAPTVLGNFDGFPDPTEAKADAHVTGVRAALQHPNVTLMTHAFVYRLGTDETGRRVTTVEVERHGQRETFRANVIILAAGAINSAALLLRSASDRHPHGLANSSGLVGRNYMAHINGCLIAYTPDKLNTSFFQKYFCIGDFYESSARNPYPLGEIQLMGKNDPATVVGLSQTMFPDKAADWLCSHSIDFWLTTEDLPDPENRVTLTPSGHIQLLYHRERNNVAAFEQLKQSLKDLFCRLGDIDPALKTVHWAGYDLGISGVSHQCGTLRFGTDPATSVLDTTCKAHDLDNLYVADASFFPSSGAYNPSLTTAANALRVGDHLLQQVL
ncbi:GMC family oxidoreductase [Fibrisoma montanum]|uniref:GMC family oxidoreductase n=1 Tax=Fibrisoma montanum TaxID=2305895 RepID=A0A418MCB1_9BACT|nr:GMC family oxidoreductase [Fibrisoma montanum]RIV24022.1 GMC family oxidoreductase [Fibrisoma montanum]